MLGLQMSVPLLVSDFIAHAARHHGSTEIVARTVEGAVHRYTYAEADRRARQLAAALARLDMRPGDRVGSLAWNTHRHFELFYGVSGSGLVLHTVNPRLHPDQIAYVINHAEDRILFVDAATLPILEAIAPCLTTVEHVVMMTEPTLMPATSAIADLICHEDLIARESGDYDWPVLDERMASSICYTSGTTGNPKGVVYSHRSAVLSTMMLSSFTGTGACNGSLETLMPLAPMFHGNAWQFPYLAPMTGARLVLPGRHYEPARLHELIAAEGVTVACGVPSIWIMLADWLRATGNDLARLRLALSSGSAPPRSLVELLERSFGVAFGQAWGMAEAIAGSLPTLKPGAAELPDEDRMELKLASGRAAFGVKYRLVDDDERELAQDGDSRGHLRIRSPWAASGYFKDDGTTALDDEGWLVTGDVATVDAGGHIRIVDRSRDLIKSGGEWISSVELESAAGSHPDVRQAAVIGVAHDTWHERPLLVVERREGGTVDALSLKAHIAARVARWMLPDEVVFIDSMPMTGTGKIHKPTLRQRFAKRRDAA